MGSNYREVTGILLLAAGDMSLSTVSSAALELKGYNSASFHFSWLGLSGSAIGSLKVEGSPDGLLNWSDMGISIIGPASNDSNDLVDFQRIGVPYVRLTYTKTSGAGTLRVIGNKKGC